MGKDFDFEIVSPERILLSKKAEMVTIPGEDGDFGVLAQHAPMIVGVRPGVVEVFEKEGTAQDRIFIAGGFAEVQGDRCTILAEQAIPVDRINSMQVEGELKALREDLGIAKTAHERTAIDAKILVCHAKMQAVG